MDQIILFALLGLGTGALIAGMASAFTMVDALKKAGPDLTREALITGLNNLGTVDYGIQSAPLTFTPEDHAGIKAGKMITYKDGKAVIVGTHP